MECERCHSNCELCPAYFPWNDQFWICSECGSTYIYEWSEEKKEKGKLKAKI